MNRDGSLNVKLDAIPVNGEIHIRDYVPRAGAGNEDFATANSRKNQSSQDDDDVNNQEKFPFE